MKQSWTDLQVITQLSSDSRWYGQLITFAFPTTVFGIYGTSGELTGFVPMTQQQQNHAMLALFTWDDLIRPNIEPSSVSSNSDIEFGYSSTGIEYAHAYLPLLGSVWFSNQYDSLRNPELGSYGFNTYIHEIGHALGLDHMGDYDGSDNDGPSSWQDSSVFTIMSYYGPSNNSGGEGEVAWADWIGSDGIEYSPQTPMVNDVMAIQSIYGQGATRLGDTIYGFNSNIGGLGGIGGQIYDFSLNLNPILCIYDSAGIDTLNLSGWSTNSRVDLNDGPDHFSSCNNMTNNIQIARGVLIENAITGAGDDYLLGNEFSNRLIGGQGQDTFVSSAGNDTLDGGQGTDVIVLNATRDRFLVDHFLDASDPMGYFAIHDRRGFLGTDYLVGIEHAQFTNESVAITELTSSGVYRFFNPGNGVHFYTGSSIEAESVKASLPGYIFEGIAFQKSMGINETGVLVHRFYNVTNNAHFYTANEQEVAAIRATFPSMLYEGLAYQAHATATENSTALYRFFNTKTGTHFYTANENEKENVLLTLSGTMNYEGIAFYVDFQ